MTDVPRSAAGNPIGFGSMLRKEDARFLRGRGCFLDDVRLPGMLYGAVLRSPYAHARITAIDVSAAEAHPKVRAVLTGEMLAERALAWMPTMSGDTQAVLATDKVRFQGQEVAFVVAEDRYSARDALELIQVDYEVLPPVVDVRRALDADAPVVRTDLEDRTDNRIYDWEAGDAAACDEVFRRKDVVVSVADLIYPRSHPSPMETCGSVAWMDRVTGKLTCWITSQAPHAHRTIYALVAGLPEHKIQVISPDIGGGFGNKVPVYPGYVCVVVASIVTGAPVKWVEDRSENLMSTGFARDYHMHGEIAATPDGRILALRTTTVADHGAFHTTAQPTKFPAGFFSIFTGSYDLEAAHCKVTAVYTNKAPGGVAYACSFRITEAVYLVERMVDILAHDLGMDPAEVRMKNLIRPEQFPYVTKTGWEYDSGDYPTALQMTLDAAGYKELRAEQAEVRARFAEAGEGNLLGIGLSFFTEGVGAGPRRHMDILGLGMADGCELRLHPTGKAVIRLSVQTQGQGHETTFAQIVAHELGLPPEDVEVVHGDTDQTPFGLGTYGSRSTPVSGAAAAVVSRRVRDKARIIAAAALECSPDDLEWEPGRWQVKGSPSHGRTIQQIALLAHSNLELPEGVEGHLDASAVYNPPNLTYPYGAYLCVVDVDPGTGAVKVRRFVATDDCGPRINPMIVEGQIHGGLTDGIGMALMQVIAFDELGNCLGGSFMDYLLPTARECPTWETHMTVTPSPHHPLGCKGVGESATVGSPAAVVNAVMDALAPFGVRHADMPLTPAQVWLAVQAARPEPTWPSRNRRSPGARRRAGSTGQMCGSRHGCLTSVVPIGHSVPTGQSFPVVVCAEGGSTLATATSRLARNQGVSERLRRRLSAVDQGFIVAGVVLALVAGFSFALDGFLTTGNLLDAARNSAVLGILAVGMAIVVVGRGLDLSIVVIMGVTSQLVAEYMNRGHGEIEALLFGLALAVAFGLINGVLVAYVEIPALFVTLATSLLYVGASRLIYLDRLNGRLPDFADFTTTVARSRPLGIPSPVLILAAVVVAAYLFMTRTSFGRFIYARGDNPAAASVAGIPVRPLTVLTYAVSALLAFVAGVLALGLAGGFDARAMTSGSQLYDVIAVVVIGGVSLAGGRGSLGGVLAGALLIGVLVNGMTLLDFDTIQQSLWKSVIVLAALVLDGWLHPRDEETARPGEL